MWDNLIFSVNVVLPIFIMILLGFIGRRVGILEKEMMEKLAGLTFRYFLSVKIALSTYKADMRHVPGMRMCVFCMIGLTVCFIVIWLLAHRFLKKKESVGSFVHCSFRGSITVLGLSLATNLAGDEGAALCAPLIAFCSILNNVLAVICLSKTPKDGNKGRELARAAVRVLKNPMILGAAAGTAASLLRLPCPTVLLTPLEYLASLAVPLSLLCIGAALTPEAVKRSGSYALGAALIKTVGMAAVTLPIAAALGFRGTELAIIGFFFLLANPSGCYVMTLAMDGDADLAASATVLSTAISVFTVTLMLWILKTLALI